jgi:excisionase family DNA binding protein
MKDIEGPLTAEDLARLARVSVRTVYRWVRVGKLVPVPVRLGKRLLFGREQVAALLPPSAA